MLFTMYKPISFTVKYITFSPGVLQSVLLYLKINRFCFGPETRNSGSYFSTGFYTRSFHGCTYRSLVVAEETESDLTGQVKIVT